MTKESSRSLDEFDFHGALIAMLPRLKLQAFALAKNREHAEDLVQTAVANALNAKSSFQPGTNLQAWMYRILRNRFLSDCRAKRDVVELDAAPQDFLVSSAASQEDSFACSELRRKIALLPPEQRASLVMVAVEGMSYAEVSEVMGCAEGTAKCRVFRARQQLEIWLLGDGEGRRSAARLTDRPARRNYRARSKDSRASV